MQTIDYDALVREAAEVLDQYGPAGLAHWVRSATLPAQEGAQMDDDD